MAMNNLAESIALLVFLKGKAELEQFALSLLASRFGVAASMARNPEEVAEIQKMANAVKYVVEQDGTAIRFILKHENEYPYLEVIEKGLHGLHSGGNHGLVTEPNGDTHISDVPVQLQGTSLPWLDKEPEPITEEANKILESTAPEMIEDIVQSSEEEISAEVAKELDPMLQRQLGGK